MEPMEKLRQKVRKKEMARLKKASIWKRIVFIGAAVLCGLIIAYFLSGNEQLKLLLPAA